MLASWFHYTERNWEIIWHDDGSLDEAFVEQASTCIPGCQFVRKADADARMNPVLEAYPHLKRYRNEHPLGMKSFDMPHLTDADRFIILDADVLFFDRPGEILDWVDARDESCWFNRDAAEPAPITYADARERLGVELWHWVNSGLCLLNRDSIDFEFMERCIQDPSLVNGKQWRVEQTLLALCASRAGAGGLLSDRYEVCLEANGQPDHITRHYVGMVRDRFYAEGIRMLKKTLL